MLSAQAKEKERRTQTEEVREKHVEDREKFMDSMTTVSNDIVHGDRDVWLSSSCAYVSWYIYPHECPPPSAPLQ